MLKKLSFAAAKPAVSKILAIPLVCAIWWICVDSYPFWRLAISSMGTPRGADAAFFSEALVVFICAVAAVIALLQALLGVRASKVLLFILSVIGAGGFAFSVLYNAVMSPDMLRNALATDIHEVMGLMSLPLFGYFALGAIPVCVFLWFFPRAGLSGASFRLKSLGLSVVLFAAAGATLYFSMQDFSFFMRGHREARYLITPFNVVYSAVRTQAHDKSPDSNAPRAVVDASPALAAAPGSRPLVVVVAVGETARAANWGLDGYARDTTPELRALGVTNYARATSCGTSTDVSVPCMFSRIGRRNYDRRQILAEEPLAPLLKRAGASVKWIENQSGCKGACLGVDTDKPKDHLSDADRGRLCPDGLCFDEVLTPYVKDPAVGKAPVTVLFLHMAGSHGPAYARRYPQQREKWGPVCSKVNLSDCDPKELRNAYDNSILYTDHVLAQLIGALKDKKDADTVLIYASDHGESLGEKGMYLHGAPWAIAPDEQTRIPMILWMSDGFKKRQGIDAECAAQRALKPSSHDNLWSTILGLTGVKSSAYKPADDLLGACRRR